MPKSESAETLLKRLEKIQRAQGRLGDITARILAQAETLADLLKLAQGFADPPAPPANPRSRATGASKPTAAKRTTRKGASARATTGTPAPRRKPAAAGVKAASTTRPRRSSRST